MRSEGSGERRRGDIGANWLRYSWQSRNQTTTDREPAGLHIATRRKRAASECPVTPPGKPGPSGRWLLFDQQVIVLFEVLIPAVHSDFSLVRWIDRSEVVPLSGQPVDVHEGKLTDDNIVVFEPVDEHS